MVTIREVKNKFNEYNAKYFNNSLPPITLEIGRKSKYLGGTFRWKNVPNSDSKALRIVINKHPQIMDNENAIITMHWKHVLLHEMVHYLLHEKYKVIKKNNLKRYIGHTREFFTILKTSWLSELYKTIIVTKEVKQIPLPTLIPITNHTNYKIVSSGKIGKFIRNSVIYGKKHIVLQVEDMLFPYCCPAENVVPI